MSTGMIYVYVCVVNEGDGMLVPLQSATQCSSASSCNTCNRSGCAWCRSDSAQQPSCHIDCPTGYESESCVNSTTHARQEQSTTHIRTVTTTNITRTYTSTISESSDTATMNVQTTANEQRSSTTSTTNLHTRSVSTDSTVDVTTPLLLFSSTTHISTRTADRIHSDSMIVMFYDVVCLHLLTILSAAGFIDWSYHRCCRRCTLLCFACCCACCVVDAPFQP